jgi:hypothetical protein
MKPLLLSALLLSFTFTSRADEGMWLFNQPPREILRERYQFEPTDAWLEHLQKASVRIGASGSFVSEDGLFISNHHVGGGSLQKLSTKEKNYLRDGFYARTPAEELKNLDLEINVLQSIEDVSARVNAAVPKDANAADAFAARRKVIAGIEKESLDQTGLRSEVVTLWQGGTYNLYRYKRYTDVRIVFAPEQQAAFFGGDPDNFEFPRYDFDICLFRAYENGQPAKTKDFLKFSPTGPRDGELVFVSGHPGGTSRLLTMAELDNLRDQGLPLQLASLKRREVLLANWSARAEENARRARELFFGVQNSRKALDGRLAGLLDPQLMDGKIKAETEFKSRLTGKPEFSDALAAYENIASATRTLASQAAHYALLERGDGLDCDSFRIARTLLRAGDERPKPNGDRLREFSDANKASLELGLFSTAPIYPDLEILRLSDALTFLATQFSGDNPLVKKVLEGRPPHERAVELINGTKVRDVAFRKQLYDGGANAVSAANDPMIELARMVEPDARALRKVSDEQSEAKQEAHAAIASAANTLLGTGGSRYPDATGTLRLSFGTVKGDEEDGKPVPAFTTFAGLYERAKDMKDRPPFDLPASWEAGRKRLDLKTPYNFVSTCDIIGGNSGSPVVNRAGEFVGIIFDGNIQSLPLDYAFDDKQARAVSVDSAAIIEGLDKIYHAKELVQELLNGKRSDGGKSN